MRAEITGDEHWHGLAGSMSNHGCHCDKCRAGNAARMRRYRKKRAMTQDGSWIRGRWVPDSERRSA